MTFNPASTKSWIRCRKSFLRLHEADAGLGLARRKTHEAADAPEVLTENVAADIDLGAVHEPLRAARIAQGQLVLTLVVDAGVVLVLQSAIAQLDSAAERGAPADAQAVTLSAHAVAGHPIVPAPVPDDVPVVGLTERVDLMCVPAVLPLRHLVGEIEAIPQPRQVESRGQRGVAQPPALFARAVLAGVLEVHGERLCGRENELAGQRGSLIAELSASVPVLS